MWFIMRTIIHVITLPTPVNWSHHPLLLSLLIQNSVLSLHIEYQIFSVKSPPISYKIKVSAGIYATNDPAEMRCLPSMKLANI